LGEVWIGCCRGADLSQKKRPYKNVSQKPASKQQINAYVAIKQQQRKGKN
jgi:hypothetical protein